MKKLLLKNVIQTLAAIVFLIVVWLIAYFSIGNELLVPSFKDSLKQMANFLTKSAFWTGVGYTLLRALYAFLLSFLLGLIFAIIAYLVPAFEKFFAPIAAAFRSVPVLALLLILLCFLGVNQAPIAVAFLSLFPMLYTDILTALLGVDKQVIDSSRVCGTPLFRRIYAIYLPLSAPYICRQSGAALGFSVKLIVSAEVLANTTKSLGGMMQEAKIYENMPQLFALVTASFVIALLLETLVSLLATAIDRKLA